VGVVDVVGVVAVAPGVAAVVGVVVPVVAPSVEDAAVPAGGA
jgi:hypothetical protein